MSDDSLRFSGVKVFSATLAEDRDRLGEKVTAWLHGAPGLRVVDQRVMQSSDAAFHCLTIIIFYRDA